MDQRVLVGLVNNAALLLALVVLYDTFATYRRRVHALPARIVTGLVLGSVAVAIMLNPVLWAPGVVFDTRTVLLGAVGLFFSPLTTLSAMLVSASYRIHVGGVGAPMGIATILLSGATGIVWQRARGGTEKDFSFGELYAFGLVVHVLMLASMGLLPRGLGFSTLKTVGPPVILLYPAATALLGGLLGHRAANLRRDVALRESEMRYRALFDLSPDGVVVVDPATAAFVEFNEQACRQLGYTREEFGRLRIPDIEFLETSADTQTHIVEVTRTGSAEFDTVQRTKQGEPRHVHVKARYSKVGGKGVYHCIWRDIHREKRAELVTKARLHLLRYSLSHTMEEFLTETLDRLEELTGSQIGFFHLVDEARKSLTLHAWSTRTTRDFCRAEGTGSHYGIEQAGVWVDCLRERRPVIHNDYESLPHRKGLPSGHAAVVRELTIPIVRADAVVAILGIGNKPTAYTEEDVSLASDLSDLVWDTAESKAAQEALRESEEKFTAAFDKAPVAIAITDLEEGTYLDVNQAFLRISGFRREEVLGKTPEGIGWLDPAERGRIVATVRQEGRVQDAEVRARAKSGKSLLFRYWGEPIALAGRQRLLAVGLDVTEYREMESQLRQAQKMEAVGALAGGIAHDFNNMLCVVLGHTELAMAQTPSDSPIYEDLEEISRAAKRSADITGQLLAFARKQTAVPKVLDLNETLEPMLKMIRRLIGEDIDLAWRPADGLGKVRIDPGQLNQILANLATNARDAIDGVGRVVVETGNAAVNEGDRESGPDALPGEYVTLTVSDDGCGIEGETMASLFDPFFTTKEVGKGTGLGLAIVHGIVSQNRGFVRVRSESGRGASFKIYLPRVEDTAPSEEPAIRGRRGGTERVLIVEDEEANLNPLQRYLTTLGYEVSTATSPAQAIALTETERFDLLVTDVVMPGMNGRDLAATLLANRPGLRCLFMSGYTANVAALQGVLEEGVNFLQKPFSLREFGDKVREALD